MNSNQLKLFTVVAAVTSLMAMNIYASYVFADKSDAQHGINRADNNVHNIPEGEGGLQDTVFHNGLDYVKQALAQM